MSSLNQASAPLIAKQPLQIVLDWDGTITQKDTLDELVNIAVSSKKPPDPSIYQQKQSKWDQIKELYARDVLLHEASGPVGSSFPRTAAEQALLLSSLEDIEERSLQRVSESRIFQGLSRESLSEGAASAIQNAAVEMRPGWRNLFDFLKSSRNLVYVISVNWSRHFIASCLRAAGSPLDPKTESMAPSKESGNMDQPQTGEPCLRVFANELQGLEAEDWGIKNPSNGTVLPTRDGEWKGLKLRTSADKLRCFVRIRQRCPQTTNLLPAMYIGDSLTDFECLLAADLGICVRDDPMSSTQSKLAEALERVDVQCVHIAESRNQLGEGCSRVVWARDFNEIVEWLKALK